MKLRIVLFYKNAEKFTVETLKHCMTHWGLVAYIPQITWSCVIFRINELTRLPKN